MNFFYWLAVNLCWIYQKIFFRINVKGIENIPDRNNGYILTANHLSYFDPFVVAKYVPDLIHFIATEEFFRYPVISNLMKYWECIAIKRNTADRQALRDALIYLHHNKVIGVFPEGGINKSGNIDQYQAGVALLSINSGKPVLPVYIEGTRNLYRPSLLKRKSIFIHYKPVLDFRKISFDISDNKEIRRKVLKLIEDQLKVS